MSNKYDLNDFVHTITEQNVLDAIVEKVKTRRKELKLTQQDMAKRSGVSYASIRRFENTGEISFTSLLKIASVLNALADFNLLFNTENVTTMSSMFYSCVSLKSISIPSFCSYFILLTFSFVYNHANQYGFH